jgi:hypothetical protein
MPELLTNESGFPVLTVAEWHMIAYPAPAD